VQLRRPVVVADLLATFVFALQGGATAAAAGLDVFGILVVAFVAALGGGVVRDVLIGDVPPAAFRSTVYPVVAFGGGAVATLLFGLVRDIPPLALGSLDAAGLALFAVVGAAKAHDHGMNLLLAAMLGAMSGVGGGVMRDLLLGHVPAVLNSQVYAVAALAGATATVMLLRLRVPRAIALGGGAVICLVLRLLALWYGWQLPRIV
jgi:uncharacterized membrane protein YeiH